MRILVTGSRDWSDKVAIANAIRQAWIDADKPYRVTVIHGGARGADYIAGVFANRMRFDVEVHEADWSIGKQAGYIRNKEMVDAGADVCLAFIRNESKGATMCADLAEKAGIPTKIWRQ
jgi:hypothetical protein